LCCPERYISALPAPATVADEYQIGVDDMVQVSVWRNPELGITAPVRRRQDIGSAGRRHRGRRSPRCGRHDQEKLSARVREPQVTVILTELRSHEYLSGARHCAVRQPISIPYRQGMTADAVLGRWHHRIRCPDRPAARSRRHAITAQLGNILNSKIQ
jgi:polysaccharide export outer membrane protein